MFVEDTFPSILVTELSCKVSVVISVSVVCGNNAVNTSPGVCIASATSARPRRHQRQQVFPTHPPAVHRGGVCHLVPAILIGVFIAFSILSHHHTTWLPLRHFPLCRRLLARLCQIFQLSVSGENLGTFPILSTTICPSPLTF